MMTGTSGRAMENNDRMDGESDRNLDAEEVILQLGGIRPAAAKLGVPVTTVQGWKNRGRIPENRRAEIAEALHELGIEATVGRPTTPDEGQPAHSESPDHDGQNSKADEQRVNGPVDADQTPEGTLGEEAQIVPVAEGGRPARSSLLGTVGLILAAISFAAVAVVVFRPDLLLSLPGGKASGIWRMAVEAERNAQAANDGLSARIHQILARQNAVDASVKQIAAQFEATDRRLLDLEGASGTDVESIQREVRELIGRLNAVVEQSEKSTQWTAGELSRISEKYDQQLKSVLSDLVALREKVETADRQLSLVSTAQSRAPIGRTALLVAVGQLEAAALSGRNYSNVLDRLVELSSENPAALDILQGLRGNSATAEDVSEKRLQEEFAQIRSVLAAGRPPPEGWNLLEGAWAQVKSTVRLRKTGQDSDSPITIVESALAQGDLERVMAVTEGYGVQVDRWRRKVEMRLGLIRNLDLLNKAILAPSSQTRASQ